MSNYIDIHPDAIKATEEYKKTWEMLSDKSYWPLKMFISINIFFIT